MAAHARAPSGRARPPNPRTTSLELSPAATPTASSAGRRAAPVCAHDPRPRGAAVGLPTGAASARAGRFSFAPEPLNGIGNNRAQPDWGAAGSPYRRLAPARYADGVGAMSSGPEPRYVTNRIFNSLGVDLFSARYVSQWGWVWGQFLDHTLGLARTGSESAPIAV